MCSKKKFRKNDAIWAVVQNRGRRSEQKYYYCKECSAFHLASQCDISENVSIRRPERIRPYK